MDIPDSLLHPGAAEPGRAYRIAFADADFAAVDCLADIEQYTGEFHDGRWHVWDLDGEKLEGEFPDAEIIVLDRD